MSISNIDMTVIKPEIEPSRNNKLKKFVNNRFKLFGKVFGNTNFYIMPSKIIHSDENGYYLDGESGPNTHSLDLENVRKQLNLEGLERGVPRIYLNGKYNTVYQALAQAKNNYPNRFIIARHLYYRTIAVIYHSNADMFSFIEVDDKSSGFQFINGDII